jgi:hypothetical protein
MGGRRFLLIFSSYGRHRLGGEPLPEGDGHNDEDGDGKQGDEGEGEQQEAINYAGQGSPLPNDAAAFVQHLQEAREFPAICTIPIFHLLSDLELLQGAIDAFQNFSEFLLKLGRHHGADSTQPRHHLQLQ